MSWAAPEAPEEVEKVKIMEDGYDTGWNDAIDACVAKVSGLCGNEGMAALLLSEIKALAASAEGGPLRSRIQELQREIASWQAACGRVSALSEWQSEFIQKMEPLGEPFASILEAHRDELYEK